MSLPAKGLKYLVFISLCCTLAACGFTPQYGRQAGGATDAAREKLAQVHIGNVPDREGQFLRNALIDRFYRSGAPVDGAYSLKLAPVEEDKTELDITKSSDATRGQLRLSTTMIFSDRESGAVLLEQPLMAITSYNILQSQFTTRVSEENARENALNELARQVETRLVLYFNRP